MSEWIQRRIDGLCDDVVDADIGSGSCRPANSALYRAAFSLGQYVPHLISQSVVYERLIAANVQRARPMRSIEVERTIEKGLGEGMQNPWHPTKTKSAPRTTASMKSSSKGTSASGGASDEKVPPDPREVMELWGRCTSVLEDAEVCAWLRAHQIDPVRVDADNLAGALPKSAALPRWARSWIGGDPVTWAKSGHRLVLPLVDVAGNLRSVLARDVTEKHREKKSLSPAKHARKGFFMRDPAARLVLWPDRAHDDTPELAGPERWYDDAPERRIIIVEGEKKYMQLATHPSDADVHAPATIGIVSGSWSDELGALIPNGWHVRIEVDPDGTPEGPKAGGGAQYATKILRSLVARHEAGTLRLELRREFVIRPGRYGLAVHVAEAS